MHHEFVDLLNGFARAGKRLVDGIAVLRDHVVEVRDEFVRRVRDTLGGVEDF
ncbi:hypothetical protein D3C83_177080 [compost metagenome]